jgi:DNA polymerase-1
MKKRLVLIDGHAIVFRAFHAYPLSLTTSKGELINAVYGFANMLLAVLRELGPSHVAVAFDLDKPTFRHLDYVDYKANRPEVAEELTGQLERVREVVRVLNIPIFEIEGFEADDVIGTLAKQAGKAEVVIVTGDQDAMQLVNKGVKVYLPGRGKQPAKLYGIREVEERYELEPEQIVDLKALAGDPSDNIPGVKGIGPKTAKGLLKKYMTVERIYAQLDKGIKKGQIKPKVGEELADGYEEAMRSKKLAAIVTNVPIKLNWKDCRLLDYDKAKAVRLFKKLEFRSLIKKLPNDIHDQKIEDVFLGKTKAKKNRQHRPKAINSQMEMFK